jgi:cellulase/cellobiase CelA1
VLAQALEQFIRRHYARWCDETIPALGGLTPRQAIVTPAGLARVNGLLREYEDGEQRQSAAQGRPAVSYQFLWDALGIQR